MTMYPPNNSLTRTRSIHSMRCLGPATLALERSVKRRRVSNETEGLLHSKVAVGVDSLDSLFSSLIQTNAEDQFPTIAWVFDDDDK